MEGEGRIGEYVGGYSDWARQSAQSWLRQKPASPEPAAASKPQAIQPAKPVAAAPLAPAKAKLSYKDARELEQLPARIDALEAELATLAAAMSSGSR